MEGWTFMRLKVSTTVVILFLLIIMSSSAFAVQQLISFQGKVDYLGELVTTGDLEVTIWDDATGGSVVYNSSTDFLNNVTSGYFDVMLGSVTALDLNYNQNYWLDLKVNHSDAVGWFDVDWDGNERKKFDSMSGDTFSNDIQINNGSFFVCAGGNCPAPSSLTAPYEGDAYIEGNVEVKGILYVNGTTMDENYSSGAWNTSGENLFPSDLSNNVIIGAIAGHQKLNVLGNVNITETSAASSNGTIYLGSSTSGGSEYIGFRTDLGARGKFVATAPFQIYASSPAITFVDADDPDNETKWTHIVYNADSAYPIQLGANVAVNGSMHITGSSPAAITFGSGADSQNLTFDSTSQEFSFTGGKMVQDFSNIVKNGGFESFNVPLYDTWAWDTGTGYSLATPDEWSIWMGTSNQYAPTDLQIGNNVYQGYNSLRLSPYSASYPGDAVQTLEAYELQPDTWYSIGVRARVSSTSITANLSIGGSALDTTTGFTMQSTTSTTWALLQGKFKTKSQLTPWETIQIHLKADGASTEEAFFDAVQLNTGHVVGEYQDKPVTSIGEQTIYGGLNLQRSGQGRGGVLTVEKSVRTREIEFSFADDPTTTGLDYDRMMDPRYDASWTSGYTPDNIKLELGSDYMLRMARPGAYTGIEFDLSNAGGDGPTISTFEDQNIQFASPVEIFDSGSLSVTELVTNGEFATDSTGWTCSGSYISCGRSATTGLSGTGNLYFAGTTDSVYGGVYSSLIPFETGKRYKISFLFKNEGGSTSTYAVDMRLDKGTSFSSWNTLAGSPYHYLWAPFNESFEFFFEPTETAPARIMFYSYGEGMARIDKVSVKEVTEGSGGSLIVRGLMTGGGSSGIKVEYGGDVGIGTTDPTEALEVSGTVKATTFIGDGSSLSGISSGYWNKTGTEVYYEGGYIGIGTALPNSSLHVVGDIKVENSVTFATNVKQFHNGTELIIEY